MESGTPSNLETELLQAAENNNVEAIQSLHFSQITDASKRNAILLTAVKHGSIAVVKLLIRHGFYTESTGSEGHRAIHLAAEHDEASILEILARAGANLNARNASDETVLHVAVRFRHIGAVRCLLALKACHSLQDAVGCTPLHDAITSQQNGIVKLLLDANADISVRDKKGFNCLHRAAFIGNVNILNDLLPAIRQQQVINKKNEDGQTALHLASKEGHLGVAEVLIKEVNADVSIQNNNFQTALHLAIHEQHREIVQLLVNEGASVNVKDKDGDSPMHEAARFLQPEQLQDLGDSYMNQVENETLVFRMNKSISIACLLAASGADLTSTNEVNQTPLDLCCGPNLVKAIIKWHNPSAHQRIDPLGLEIQNPIELELRNLKEKIACPICRTHYWNVVFMCGHFTCQECGSRLETCHMCREQIERRVTVYWK